jgi:hypothetical protein
MSKDNWTDKDIADYQALIEQSERSKEAIEKGECWHIGNIWTLKRVFEMKSQLQKLQEENTRLNEAIVKCFEPHNIECDGAWCQGCWKDILRPIKDKWLGELNKK